MPETPQETAERLLHSWCKGEIQSVYHLCLDIAHEATINAIKGAISETGTTDSTDELRDSLRDWLADAESARHRA